MSNRLGMKSYMYLHPKIFPPHIAKNTTDYFQPKIPPLLTHDSIHSPFKHRLYYMASLKTRGKHMLVTTTYDYFLTLAFLDKC